ncbi:MAG TPA: Gfo/Idh/MocA family oxidoreductase [Anaerolineales bacterium]|nr:Gfo/Idh/MocA family oxidoreductase [Anaerolineales bacterium]
MKKLRWGLLSTARINWALLPPLRASARNELTAVASRDLERAQTYARERNIPRAFGSYEAMLGDSDVDVIYNPLPNSMHAEWTIKAAQAGKHVLCEKPLAITVEEVDAITAAAHKAGVIVMEAFMYRHHPQTLKVKQLVESGEIGKLQLIRGSFTFNITNENDVRLNSSLGGGSIWDIGCYPISYARLIAGAEPLEVFGWQKTGAGSGVDESFFGQMHFSNDVYAQLDCGFRSPQRTHIELVGDKGNITVKTPFTPRLNEEIILTNGDEKRVITTPGEDLYLGEVENMADAVLQIAAPRMSLADSRNNVAAIKALLRSAQEGRAIAL